MHSGDTIAAISSAVGSSARMIVRASGPDAVRLASSLCIEPFPSGAFAKRLHLQLDELRFPAWLYCFRGPNSITGEDIVEFHLPGNPLLARLLLDKLVASGARAADPGEFTARGYFNNRLDLAEAEGVAATISANSEREMQAARRLLSGELARRLNPIMDLLAHTLALIEAGIDFADEGIVPLSLEQASERVTAIDAHLQHLLIQSAQFESLTHEPTIALVGRPNAGKSTLLNALAGHERAVVSPVAGTTRDVLVAHVALRRGTVRLLDAAGLETTDSDEEIARQMQEASRRAVETCDVLILLRDVTDTQPELPLPLEPDLRVYTKCDLAAGPGTCISAISGQGMRELRERLDELAFGASADASSLALNSRHIDAIAVARAALSRGGGSAELLALDLREALDALGGILGAVTPDDVLGRIFSTFCIGK